MLLDKCIIVIGLLSFAWPDSGEVVRRVCMCVTVVVLSVYVLFSACFVLQNSTSLLVERQTERQVTTSCCAVVYIYIYIYIYMYVLHIYIYIYIYYIYIYICIYVLHIYIYIYTH